MEWKKQGKAAPKWGSRRVILNDLSPASAFIASNYNVPFDVDVFERDAKSLLDEFESEWGWMYLTLRDPSDAELEAAVALLAGPGFDFVERAPHLPWARIDYTVWSDVYKKQFKKDNVIQVRQNMYLGYNMVSELTPKNLINRIGNNLG